MDYRLVRLLFLLGVLVRVKLEILRCERSQVRPCRGYHFSAIDSGVR